MGDACRTLYRSNQEWLSEIATLSPEKALSVEAEMAGFRGPGRTYREWVKETLFFTFLPVLEAAAASFPF